MNFHEPDVVGPHYMTAAAAAAAPAAAILGFGCGCSVSLSRWTLSLHPAHGRVAPALNGDREPFRKRPAPPFPHGFADGPVDRVRACRPCRQLACCARL